MAPPRSRRWRSAAVCLSLLAAGCATGGGAPSVGTNAPQSAVSAPIADVRYEVRFDSATAATRTIQVSMSFTVAGSGAIVLALPVWTPGAYEVSNFARWVTGFEAVADGQPVRWERPAPDRWRLVPPAGAREVTVRFDYRADTLDNAMAWARPDFAFFNGTNVFLHAAGRSLDFPATVTVHTQPGWRVATGMTAGGGAGVYREESYHDLVDMPFFVGRFDYDSTMVQGRPVRLATYPAGAMAGEARSFMHDAHERMLAPMEAVFDTLPFTTYTTMIVVTDETPGGSALEHQNSHVGIYNPGVLNPVTLPSITAHEIFHLWNVKRLRPATMWPYDYSRMMPTPLLWWSEGVTDYYSDLALVRGGIVDSATFLALTAGKIQEVGGEPPVSLEDASVVTWIHPIQSPYVYYSKGSLAGLMLDILIRDASDDSGSLDTVMRELYREAYEQGRGFTNAMLWRAVSAAAGGRSFDDEYQRYVAGREAYPWSRVLPLAGLRLVSDSLRVPLLGVSSQRDSAGTVVVEVSPGGAAARAGLRVGDRLLRVGEVEVGAEDFGPAFRSRYAGRSGAPLPIVVLRDGVRLTVDATVEVGVQVSTRIIPDGGATGKALRIRNSLFHGAGSSQRPER